MRRAIPLLTVGVLVLVAVGSGVLGLAMRSHSGPTVQADQGGNNLDAQAGLRAAVRRTLQLQSFTIANPAGTLTYQAPDRTEAAYPLGEIVIGSTIYQGLNGTVHGSETTVKQWGRGSLTSGLGGLYGPTAAKAELRFLLRSEHVTATSSGYRFSEVLPLSEVVPHSAGSVPITGVVVVNHLLVTLISVRYAATEPVDYRFTGFDSSPSVVPPPAAKTVKLIPCKDGSREMTGPHGYECGLDGAATGNG